MLIPILILILSINTFISSYFDRCRKQALAFLSFLLDSSYTDISEDLDTPQMALGPVFDAVSDWILEPNKRHVEPAEVYSDRDNRKTGRQERDDRSGRNGREGGDSKEESRGLAGYLFGAVYNAGARLFTGDFAALSLGSDAEDEIQVLRLSK